MVSITAVSFGLLLAAATGSGASSAILPIVFTDRGVLMSVAPDGRETRIHKLADEASSPAWSADGRFVVIIYGPHGGRKRLAIVDSAHPAEVRRYLPDSSDFFRPKWGGDGSVYALSAKLQRTVRRWSKDGRTFADLKISGLGDRCNMVQDITLTPAGNVALLQCDFRLYVRAEVAHDGVAAREWLDLPFQYVAGAAMKADKSVVVVARRTGELGALWQISLPALDLKQLTTDIAVRDFVALSPDGSLAVITGSRGDSEPKWALWRIELDTGATKAITDGPEDVDPAWKPEP